MIYYIVNYILTILIIIINNRIRTKNVFLIIINSVFIYYIIFYYNIIFYFLLSTYVDIIWKY